MENQIMSNGRRPLVAIVLSLFCTGLGHLYAGRTGKGLTLFLLSLLVLPAVCLSALLAPSTPVLVVVLLAILALPALYLYAAIDSAFAARRAVEVAPSPIRRPAIYALFVLVGLFYPVASLVVVRGNVYQAFKVPAASMSPTVIPGDLVLVNKLTFERREPSRGDVVVFRCPGDREKSYIKRIVGLPGDRIEMVNGKVVVNGEELERKPLPGNEPEASEVLDGRPHRILPDEGDFPETKVPDDCYFVLGDHRASSRDSRAFGPVPRGDVLGPVEYVHVPAGSLSRFGRVK